MNVKVMTLDHVTRDDETGAALAIYVLLEISAVYGWNEGPAAINLHGKETLTRCE